MSIDRYLIGLNATIKRMNQARRGLYDLLIEHGRFFSPQSRPSKVPKMENGRCFQNATRLVDQYSDLIYCEGFAIAQSIPIPIHHAWVVGADGLVIDPTWEPCGLEYFGIPFDEEYHREAMIGSGYYGIIDNFRWREFINHDSSVFLFKGEIRACDHQETLAA